MARVGLEVFQAVSFQFQICWNRSRVEEYVIAVAAIDPDAGGHLLSGSAPARDLAALENLRADASSREVGGTDEAVVARPDYENVRGVHASLTPSGAVLASATAHIRERMLRLSGPALGPIRLAL